ncbi:hypothetical protein F4679DRAFT_582901 [Xylaria curta]|nr:hypothetical protein F4679DRAFT_582901 [Xylaria curta]
MACFIPMECKALGAKYLELQHLAFVFDGGLLELAQVGVLEFVERTEMGAEFDQGALRRRQERLDGDSGCCLELLPEANADVRTFHALVGKRSDKAEGLRAHSWPETPVWQDLGSCPTAVLLTQSLAHPAAILHRDLELWSFISGQAHRVGRREMRIWVGDGPCPGPAPVWRVSEVEGDMPSTSPSWPIRVTLIYRARNIGHPIEAISQKSYMHFFPGRCIEAKVDSWIISDSDACASA